MRTRNECEPITLIPMTISCSSVDPPYAGGSGSTTVNITGGIHPYSIQWEKNGDLIGNDQTVKGTAGDYNVTVVDYYGDFTATTTCTINDIPCVLEFTISADTSTLDCGISGYTYENI